MPASRRRSSGVHKLCGPLEWNAVQKGRSVKRNAQELYAALVGEVVREGCLLREKERSHSSGFVATAAPSNIANQSQDVLRVPPSQCALMHLPGKGWERLQMIARSDRYSSGDCLLCHGDEEREVFGQLVEKLRKSFRLLLTELEKYKKTNAYQEILRRVALPRVHCPNCGRGWSASLRCHVLHSSCNT